MMTRRRLLVAIGAALAAPLASLAQQQPAKVPRIGFLGNASPSTNPRVAEGFQRGLRDLGYVEGQNIVVEYRGTEGKADRNAGLVSELIRLKVDVIVVTNNLAALAAKNATTAIPIVFVAVNDPDTLGLVASLARPGGNITGQSVFSAQLAAKRIELAKEMMPRASRLAFLKFVDSTRSSREAEAAAKSLGIELRVFEVRNLADIEAAIRSTSKGGADALILPNNTLVSLHRARIADLAIKNRVSLIAPYEDTADFGALMTYDINRIDLHRRAATYVDKILKGAKPGDLPVEQPTKFELVINLKTAKTLGLTIPQSILVRADRIIE